MVSSIAEANALYFSIRLLMFQLLENCFNFFHHSDSSLLHCLTEKWGFVDSDFVIVFPHSFDGIYNIIALIIPCESWEYYECFFVVIRGTRQIGPLYDAFSELEPFCLFHFHIACSVLNDAEKCLPTSKPRSLQCWFQVDFLSCLLDTDSTRKHILIF